MPDDIIARRQTFSEYVRYLTEQNNTDVEVTYALDVVEFNEVQRIVNIIFYRHG